MADQVKSLVVRPALLERLGGRKFIAAMLVVLALLVLLFILALRDKLDVAIAGLILGTIVGILVQFGITNTKSNADFLKSIGVTKDDGK